MSLRTLLVCGKNVYDYPLGESMDTYVVNLKAEIEVSDDDDARNACDMLATLLLCQPTVTRVACQPAMLAHLPEPRG